MKNTLIICKEVLLETENLLVSTKTVSAISKKLSIHLGRPFSLFVLGLGDLVKPLTKWTFITLGLLFLGMIPFYSDNSNLESLQFPLFIAPSLALFLVSFSAPSTYVFESYTTSNLNKIIEILKKHSVKNVAELQAIRECFELTFKNITRRISFYRWTLTSIWAATAILNNNRLNMLISGEGSSAETVYMNNFNDLTASFTVAFFALGGVAIYKRATDLIMDNIQLSIKEFERQLG